MPVCSLYKITNSVNGKFYIGMTTRPVSERFKQHCHPDSQCRRLRNAMLHHGVHNFSIETLVIGDVDYISSLEISAIEHFQATHEGIGYNLVSGVSGKRALSEETIQLMRNAKGSPVYLMGFWFPSLSRAADTFSSTPAKIACHTGLEVYDITTLSRDKEKERRSGLVKRNRSRGHETVLDGVTYRSIKHASEVLGINDRTIKSIIKAGYAQDTFTYFSVIVPRLRGEGGRKGKRKGYRYRKCRIHAVEYDSIKTACDSLSMSRKQVVSRLDNPHEVNFEYINEE